MFSCLLLVRLVCAYLVLNLEQRLRPCGHPGVEPGGSLFRIGSPQAPIMDCDETFNYVAPELQRYLPLEWEHRNQLELGVRCFEIFLKLVAKRLGSKFFPWCKSKMASAPRSLFTMSPMAAVCKHGMLVLVLAG